MISAHSNTQTLFGPAAFTPDYSHIAVPKPNFNLAISSTPHESTTKTRLPADANPLGFEDLLAAADLPPPGPLHYAARRDLWLRAKTAAPPRKPEPSTSRKRLETLLNSPDAANKEEVWKGGVEKVWKGLNAGGRLKRRLPMNLVIQILHSAWVRDHTWPVGAIAPDPDDVLMEDGTTEPPQSYHVPAGQSQYPSGASTPCAQ